MPQYTNYLETPLFVVQLLLGMHQITLHMVVE